MPRKARIDAPGALHHIIVRGINRRKIFFDDKDRVDFLNRLGGILSDSKTPCFAWAFMTNHLHLLLRTGAAPIATVMRRLLTGYAVSFNRRHRRHGHLFQNRYKSILCQEVGTWDERSGDIEETEHRVLDGERILDEGSENCRRERIEAAYYHHR